MRTPMRLLCLALLALLLLPAAARASGADVIRDCGDDERLSKTYSLKEYQDALKQLGADTDEYTNCRDVIHRAELNVLAKRGKDKKESGSSNNGNSSSGAPTTSGNDPSDKGGASPAKEKEQEEAAPPPPAVATPEEQQALQQTQAGLTAASVDPDKVGAAPGIDNDGDVPGPVVAVLIALALATLTAGGFHLRSLVLARRAT